MDVCSVHHGNSFLRYSVSLLGYGFYGDVLRTSERNRRLGPARYDLAGTSARAKPPCTPQSPKSVTSNRPSSTERNGGFVPGIASPAPGLKWKKPQGGTSLFTLTSFPFQSDKRLYFLIKIRKQNCSQNANPDLTDVFSGRVDPCKGCNSLQVGLRQLYSE